MARSRNPEETREKILDVTLRLFKEKGYEKTTILEIVEGLEGLTRGAFYHHFKSKEEVLYALLARSFDRETQLDRVKSSHLNGLEKLKQILVGERECTSFKDEDDATITHIYLDLLNDPRFLSEHVKANQGKNVQWLKILIEEGMADGSIQKSDPQILTEFVLLLFNFWLTPTIYDSVTQEGYGQKLLMVKEVLTALGCPIIDEDGIEILKEQAIRYEETEF